MYASHSTRRDELPVAANLIHLHMLLLRVVFPKLHSIYSHNMDESEDIPAEDRNQALVLCKLIVYTHASVKLAVVERYAFHFESRSSRAACISSRAFVNDLEIRQRGYEVRFVDCAEHVLSDQLGYRHAKCSCAEILTRRQMPCCHILVLYLLVCNVHDQADTYI